MWFLQHKYNGKHKTTVINLRLKFNHLLVKNTAEQIFRFAWPFIWNIAAYFATLRCQFSSVLCTDHKGVMSLCGLEKKKDGAKIVRNCVESSSLLFLPPRALTPGYFPFLVKVWHCELLLLSRWRHAENQNPTGVRIVLLFQKTWICSLGICIWIDSVDETVIGTRLSSQCRVNMLEHFSHLTTASKVLFSQADQLSLRCVYTIQHCAKA